MEIDKSLTHEHLFVIKETTSDCLLFKNVADFRITFNQLLVYTFYLTSFFV